MPTFYCSFNFLSIIGVNRLITDTKDTDKLTVEDRIKGAMEDIREKFGLTAKLREFTQYLDKTRDETLEGLIIELRSALSGTELKYTSVNKNKSKYKYRANFNSNTVSSNISNTVLSL